MKKSIIFILILLAGIFSSADVFSKDTTAVTKGFDRGIGRSNSCFIPKGTVGAGVSLAYHDYSIGNMAGDSGYSMLFSLIQNMHGNMTSFSISPYASYFFADNLSVGLRFDYGRSSLGLDNLDLSLMDDLSFSLQGFHYMKQSYTGAATLRAYIPFASSKRFAMFTEVRATGGYGQAKTFKIVDGENVGTYQDIYNAELGLVPGVMAFLTNEVAFEISVGLLGFNYQRVEQVTNQVEKSRMENSGINFRVNLLSIGFGLSFYIPTGSHYAKKVKETK